MRSRPQGWRYSYERIALFIIRLCPPPPPPLSLSRAFAQSTPYAFVLHEWQRGYILNAFWKLAAISTPIYRRGTRNAWRELRGWLGERIACEPLVVATVMLGTSGREHLNNSAVYRRTYSDARAHTPRLWPLLTASWRSFGKRGEKKRKEEEEKDEGKEEEEEARRRSLVSVFVYHESGRAFFGAPSLAGLLYGDRLRAANGTETRSNATAW